MFRISPRAAKLAKESVIDPTPIKGTGPGGRIVERDVKEYLEAKGYSRVRITPVAKKLAAKEGINLLTSLRKKTAARLAMRISSGSWPSDRSPCRACGRSSPSA